jgi:hypothetical protein
VPAPKIQVGQVWKKDGSSDTYLVTKIYNEALTTFAVLRKAGSESEGTTKVKIARSAAGQTIPGYSYAQDSDAF